MAFCVPFPLLHYVLPCMQILYVVPCYSSCDLVDYPPPTLLACQVVYVPSLYLLLPTYYFVIFFRFQYSLPPSMVSVVLLRLYIKHGGWTDIAVNTWFNLQASLNNVLLSIYAKQVPPLMDGLVVGPLGWVRLRWDILLQTLFRRAARLPRLNSRKSAW